MKGEITAVTAEDGIILQGIVCAPGDEQRATGTCVIHVHGSYGNFYENFFLSPMATRYTEAGIAFVSFNTRGHDYYADLKTRHPDKYTSKRIGGICEIFRECAIDLAAWIADARRRGWQKIILQGHSLGAMKVAYYLGKHPDEAAGLILLSPPDNIGLQKSDTGDRYDEYLATAATLAEKDGNVLMPDKAYFDPITASAYLGMFIPPEDTGMFTYDDLPLMRRSSLPNITCPILATFATEGEAVVSDLAICRKALEETVPDVARLTIQVVEGANHNYHFKEEELVNVLATWAAELT